MIRPRIIVTGATGKTGSVVVTELLKVLAQQVQSSQSVLGNAETGFNPEYLPGRGAILCRCVGSAIGVGQELVRPVR